MHLLCRGVGDPILFIHGIPTSHQLWNGVIDKLQDRFTCFALDLPGFGKTPRAPHTLGHIEAIARQIELLRIQRGIHKWHIVGHDAGSAIAAQYAHLFPDSMNCLALLSPALFPDLKPYYLFEILRKPVLGELLAPYLHQIIWRVAMQRACRCENGDLDQAFTDFYAPFTGLWGPWYLMRLLRWGQPAEVLSEMPALLPKLRVPTLIFHGSRDQALPQTFAHRACRLIPNSKIVLLDCGHFIPLNRPKLVADNLLAFFRQGICL